MNRRVRHLNPKDAGAVIAIDSRFISGLSNNSEVTSWVNRAASNNAVSIASVATPNYTTNQQGGNPSVRFVSGDALQFQNALSSFSAYSVVSAIKPISTLGSGDNNAFYYGNANEYSPNYTWIGFCCNNSKWTLGNYTNPTERSVSSINNWQLVPAIFSGIVNDSGTNRLFLYGVQNSTTSSVSITGINSLAKPTLGRRGSSQIGYINADFYSVTFVPLALTASLRRKLEQSSAFSFKIACS